MASDYLGEPGLDPSPSRLRIHVEELLAEHLIFSDYSSDRAPAANPAARSVILPPVLGRRSYFDALTMIGLVIAGRRTAAPEALGDARRWALEVALLPATPDLPRELVSDLAPAASDISR
jgi:hypothetical protein